MSNQVGFSTAQAVLEDVSEAKKSYSQARFCSIDVTIAALCYGRPTCPFQASARKMLIPRD
jgi:hypothetical protein